MSHQSHAITSICALADFANTTSLLVQESVFWCIFMTVGAMCFYLIHSRKTQTVLVGIFLGGNEPEMMNIATSTIATLVVYNQIFGNWTTRQFPNISMDLCFFETKTNYSVSIVFAPSKNVAWSDKIRIGAWRFIIENIGGCASWSICQRFEWLAVMSSLLIVSMTKSCFSLHATTSDECTKFGRMSFRHA